MSDKNRNDIFKGLWQKAKEKYYTGYCISERNLQSVLYSLLISKFQKAQVIIEPSWYFEKDRIVPDIVLIEDGYIRDIFELKFMPYGNTKFEADLRKLLRIGSKTQEFPVRLDPSTGQWDSNRLNSKNCELHFVSVARNDSAAVWPESVKEELGKVSTLRRPLNHWFGRIPYGENKNEEWSIEFGL